MLAPWHSPQSILESASNQPQITISNAPALVVWPSSFVAKPAKIPLCYVDLWMGVRLGVNYAMIRPQIDYDSVMVGWYARMSHKCT